MQKVITERPVGIQMAVVALALLACTSVAGGGILLDDPSGTSMGIEFIIPYLPFNLQDFTLIGIWLVTAFGAIAVILAAGLWSGKKWAWLGSVILGAAVVTWILTEIVLFYSFGFVFFYPLIGGIGALTIILLSLTSSRVYFRG